MNALENPYTPGAGNPPPELAGRESILTDSKLAIQRSNLGRSARSFMFIGLRGVGKTVLLNELQSIAQKQNVFTGFFEIDSNRSLSRNVIKVMKSVLMELDRNNGVRQAVKRGLRVLKSFISAVKIKIEDVELSIDIDKEQGVADSGDLSGDLTDVFVATGEAARECESSIVIFIDEIQKIDLKEFNALIAAVHRVVQLNLPIILFAAGLPNTIKISGEAKSYVERLFEFPEIGSLDTQDATIALTLPAEKAGVKFDKDAISTIIEQTKGYPYFIQEWGYQSWNAALKSPITAKDVEIASLESINRLDKNFFRVRFEQLTALQQRYLKAMAKLGNVSIKSGDIAKNFDQSSKNLGSTRDALIKNGMIYSGRYGYLSFSVPLFDEYLNRTDLIIV